MAADVIYLKREKVLFDTSVYIDELRTGKYKENIAHWMRSAVVYLHSVVFEELLAGFQSAREKRELYKIKKKFSGADRVITPNDEDWEQAGLVVNRLIHRSQLPAAKAVSLTHDALIAVSARRLGIGVVTANKKDFERIRSLKEFKLTVWSSSH